MSAAGRSISFSGKLTVRCASLFSGEVGLDCTSAVVSDLREILGYCSQRLISKMRMNSV